ncbi:hypothetical protein ONV78_29130 [Hahella sp. CR1]|uniref:hypothetical protein n=1 Tax=Hahella sp. CR1 TaxID=2992807 RepID=UPI00244237EF|nr:hypothetical protein [Hahella sp. CR1]MDG9671835.1 hypothetical protein [Hahella sp. CR1]
MFTTRAVIQKIDDDFRQVRLYQNFNLSSPWSFATNRLVSADDRNPSIFPFVFHGDDYFKEGPAGEETKLRHVPDGRLLFSDDYAVPGQFVIAVLFPKGYVPDIFKFKSKPYIPTGVGLHGASISPPGHFEVYYNQKEMRSAVVFIINNPTFFGFKCIAKKFENDFPKGGRKPFLNDLYASLDLPETHPISVTRDDLVAFQSNFSDSCNLDEMASTVNHLTKLLINQDFQSIDETNALLKKVENGMSNAASIVQLSDSYIGNGTVGRILSSLFEYIAL